MTKKKEDRKIKIVELSNKSRKGKYIYIRIDNHSRYYKYQEGMKPKGILKHYLKELKRIKKNKSTVGRKLILPKKRPIEGQITRGLLEAELKDSKVTAQALHKTKEIMFKNNIKNKKLLTNIVKDHNLEKVKHRFEIIATIHGETEALATITKTGITPDKALKQINNNLKPGEYLDSSPGMRRMNELKWNGKLNREGTIKKVSVRIVFRKQK